MKVRCTANFLTIRSLPLVGIDTDTGKRMVNGQTAEVYGTTVAGQWLYVDAPAGRGWVSRQYVEPWEPSVEDKVVVSPAWPKVPNGKDEIVRIFGSAGNPMCSAGRVILPTQIEIWDGTKKGVIACHKLMEDVFYSVFQMIHKRNLWGLLHTFDGIYNPRTVTSSQKISVHAWGIGVDINAATNRLGAKPTMDPRIIAIFKDHGFIWGGDWTRPDGMHFQWAKGY